MAPVLYATSELVAQAWIASIVGLAAGVGEQLPADVSTWSQQGYITVAVVGGSPDVDVRVAKPVIQVDCYAISAGSNKPPWQQASVIAEQIRAACYDHTAYGRELRPLINGVIYPTAKALTAYVITEPRRVYDDVGDLARYQLDLALWWAQLDR